MRPILLRIRNGGKAGRRKGRFEKQQLCIGRPITKLVGIALWEHCNSLAKSCTTLRGGSENSKTNPFGGDSFRSSLFRRGRPAGAAISRKTEVSQANQPNRVREFPAEGRVWREAASSGRTRGGRSWDEQKLGRDETFRSQSHRVNAVRFGRKNVVSHHAVNAIHQRGEIKSTPPRILQSPTWVFPFDEARNHSDERGVDQPGEPVEKVVEHDFIVLILRRNWARWKRAPRFSTG